MVSVARGSGLEHRVAGIGRRPPVARLPISLAGPWCAPWCALSQSHLLAATARWAGVTRASSGSEPLLLASSRSEPLLLGDRPVRGSDSCASPEHGLHLLLETVRS